VNTLFEDGDSESESIFDAYGEGVVEYANEYANIKMTVAKKLDQIIADVNSGSVERSTAEVYDKVFQKIQEPLKGVTANNQKITQLHEVMNEYKQNMRDMLTKNCELLGNVNQILDENLSFG
jgi:Zn-dependent M32 family carboxypeptidase